MAFLKIGATALRVFQCLAAITVLAVYSTFIARLSSRNFPLTKTNKAIEAIAGIAVAYTLFGILLTCCLGGKKFFSLLAIVLDILFAIVFIVIAVLTRGGGLSKCMFTDAYDSDRADRVVLLTGKQLRTDCHLVKATFAVAIILAILFVLTAALSHFLAISEAKHHHHHATKTHTTRRRGFRSRGLFGRRGKVDTYDAEMATRH